MLSNRTKIIVGGQVFDIPSDKVGELLNILANWQSISVTEQNGNANNPTWDGKKLLFG